MAEWLSNIYKSSGNLSHSAAEVAILLRETGESSGLVVCKSSINQQTPQPQAALSVTYHVTYHEVL